MGKTVAEFRAEIWRGGINRSPMDPPGPRLNDTSAIVRKGVHSYDVVLRGEETIATAGRWTSPLDNAWNPEHAFPNGRQPPDIATSPAYGAGPIVSIHTRRRSAPGATPNGFGRGSPSPDKNRVIGERSSSLREAVNCCIPKGC